jgi:hypothetical protein
VQAVLVVHAVQAGWALSAIPIPRQPEEQQVRRAIRRHTAGGDETHIGDRVTLYWVLFEGLSLACRHCLQALFNKLHGGPII